MERKIKSIDFFERMEDCVPSFSKSDPDFLDRLRQEGWRVYSPGNGWAYISILSRIIVKTEDSSFDVAPFFRHHLGRLTKKRVDTIITSAPREIVIEDSRVDAENLRAWVVRTKDSMSRK